MFKNPMKKRVLYQRTKVQMGSPKNEKVGKT
jgi:hypothetical protein